MLEALSKRLTSASAMLLVVSVTYDLAYLLSLGLTLAELPTTISDHVRSAVVWSPLLAVFAVGFVGGAALRSIDGAVAVARTRAEIVIGLLAVGVTCLAVLSGFLGPTVDIGSRWIWQAVFAFALAVALLLAFFRPGAVALEQRLGQGASFYLFGSLAFLAIVAWMGWAQGAELLEARVPIAAVRIKQTSSERVVQVTGLRRFATVSVLVEQQESDRKLLVVQSDAILQVEYTLTPARPPPKSVR